MSSSFRVTPGQVYWCQADARLNLPDARIEMKPHVFLRVRWFGKGWIYGADYVADLGVVNQWQRLETAAIAPPGAVAGHVWICAENLWSEEQVLCDNVTARLVKPQTTGQSSKWNAGRLSDW